MLVGVRRPEPRVGARPVAISMLSSACHTSFFIIKKDISLCYGLGMDMVRQDFPFQSIREKEFQKRIKGMANS